MKPTALTLGTVQLGMPYGVANRHGMPSLDEAFAILDAAYEEGIRSIDTAPAYGESEERVGTWLMRREHSDVVVTTKLAPLQLTTTLAITTAPPACCSSSDSDVSGTTAGPELRQQAGGDDRGASVGAGVGAGAGLGAGGADRAASVGAGLDRRGAPGVDLRSIVARAVEQSRARLGHIDYYLVHDVADLRAHGAALVDALAREVDAGHVGAVGCSVYTPDDVRLVLEHPRLTAIQLPLNLVDQRLVVDGLLDALAARNITVFARSAFLQGAFALDVDALPARVSHLRPTLVKLRALLAAHGTTALDAALPFVVGRRGVTSTVVGAETVAQVKDSAARVKMPLDPALPALLCAELANVERAVVDPSLWGQR